MRASTSRMSRTRLCRHRCGCAGSSLRETWSRELGTSVCVRGEPEPGAPTPSAWQPSALSGDITRARSSSPHAGFGRELARVVPAPHARDRRQPARDLRRVRHPASEAWAEIPQVLSAGQRGRWCGTLAKPMHAYADRAEEGCLGTVRSRASARDLIVGLRAAAHMTAGGTGTLIALLTDIGLRRSILDQS